MTDEDGDIISEDGGYDALEEYLAETFPTDEIEETDDIDTDNTDLDTDNLNIGLSEYDFTYDGETYKFYIDGSSGEVTDDDGNVISEDGGYDALIDYLTETFGAEVNEEGEEEASSTLSTYDYTINGVTYEYYVDEDTGEVTDKYGNILSEDGGYDYLEDYISNKEVAHYEFTRDGTTYKFEVY